MQRWRHRKCGLFSRRSPLSTLHSSLSQSLSLSLALSRQTCKCGLINLLHVASVRDNDEDDDGDNRSNTHAHSAAWPGFQGPHTTAAGSFQAQIEPSSRSGEHITRPPNQSQIEGGRTRCQPKIEQGGSLAILQLISQTVAPAASFTFGAILNVSVYSFAAALELGICCAGWRFFSFN